MLQPERVNGPRASQAERQAMHWKSQLFDLLKGFRVVAESKQVGCRKAVADAKLLTPR
jgi:hypothetical protein